MVETVHLKRGDSRQAGKIVVQTEKLKFAKTIFVKFKSLPQGVGDRFMAFGERELRQRPSYWAVV